MLLRSNTFVVVVVAMVMAAPTRPVPFGGPSGVCDLLLSLAGDDVGDGPRNVSTLTDFRRCDVRLPRLASIVGVGDDEAVGEGAATASGVLLVAAFVSTAGLSGSSVEVADGTAVAGVDEGGVLAGVCGAESSTSFLSLFAFGSVRTSLSFNSTY